MDVQELKLRLLAGEKVRVVGKYTGCPFTVGLVESAFGVYFLCAFRKNGRRARGSSTMWGSDLCEDWLSNLIAA